MATKLEKELIVDEAFALLNEIGLDKFNMRALAARLSVSATALYWHFNDKDELFRVMSNRIYLNAYRALEGHDDWQSALLDLGQSLRQCLAACRDSARLFAIAKPAVPSPELRASMISRPLVRAGLNKETALECEAAVIAFVMGWTLYDQNPSMHEYLKSMFDFQRSFDFGLNALVQGLAVAVREELGDVPKVLERAKVS